MATQTSSAHVRLSRARTATSRVLLRQTRPRTSTLTAGSTLFHGLFFLPLCIKGAGLYRIGLFLQQAPPAWVFWRLYIYITLAWLQHLLVDGFIFGGFTNAYVAFFFAGYRWCYDRLGMR